MVYGRAILTLLFSVCTVNAGYSPLQPRTKSTAAIRGLLGRQINECDPGFGLCSNVDGCCPIGGECCTDSDGGCCDAGFYCTVGSNGVGGCCLNGESCSGPAPDPSTTTHTIEFTSTSTSFSTSFSTFTSTSESTSFPPTFSTSSTHHSTIFPSPSSTSETSSLHTGSPTFFAPQSTPTADSGYTNIFVPGNDPQITFNTNDWTDASSSCDITSTKQCRKATAESSFTYMASSKSSAGILYLDISYELTDFSIYFDGELQTISSFDIDVCTFYSIGHLPVSQSQINITIVIEEWFGNSKRQAESDSSFEFNGFLVGQSTSTATSTSSVGTMTPTASSSSVKNTSKPAGIIASVVMAMLVIMAYF
jgi:hypothetical protein